MFQHFNSVCNSNLPDNSRQGVYGPLWLCVILEWEWDVLLFLSQIDLEGLLWLFSVLNELVIIAPGEDDACSEHLDCEA